MADEDKKTEEATTEEKPEETKEAEAPAEETKADSPAEDGEDTAAAEAPTEDTSSDEAEVEVPEKFKDIVEKIENMSVLDLHELVKLFEKKFGVSAAAVAVAGAGGGEGGAEEKSSFDVELTSPGDQKIGVIKAVKEILGLGLKEAKEMVDGAPAMLKEGAAKEEAEEMKAKIEEAGGTVTLK